MEEEGIQNNPHLMGNLDRWEIEEMECEDEWIVADGMDHVEESYELSDEEIEELIKYIDKSG
ncbi:hypothetical protein [Neobacillus sp. LXY-4]|uniref:hypothetical protein n=1 Tax=Neobacillus sp. LXY-4 TaxID=3379826 RepID=UPI003EE14C91